MKQRGMIKNIKEANSNGITLVALVVTIIVLLILAAVSIATLTGENGLLTRASDANVETRAATVEERKNLWKSEVNMDEHIEENKAIALEELLDELEKEKLLIGDERKSIEETGQVTIGSKTIIFKEKQFETNLFAVADYDIDNNVRIYTDLNIEEYFNFLSDQQKIEILGKEILVELEEKYQTKITTWDSFCEYYAKYSGASKEFIESAAVKLLLSTIKIQLPKNKELTLQENMINNLGNNKELYDIMEPYSIEDFAKEDYYKGTDYIVKMYDKYGLIDEKLYVGYLFDIYECEETGVPVILKIDEPNNTQIVKPTYIYLDNGEKVNYTDYMTYYEIIGESYYNIKENPLNVEYNKLYIVETNIDGHTIKGYITFSEKLLNIITELENFQ